MQLFLFITTHNLATNPRLVKEATLALHKGFKVTIFCFEFPHWSSALNEKCKASLQAAGANILTLSAGRKPFLPWLASSLYEFFLRLLPVSFLSERQVAIACNKRSYLLLKALENTAGVFDWVIAHNPGAFYPAYFFAQQCRSRLGIDVEDYHPGETADPKLTELTKNMMQSVLPKATYCSYAAPLIAAEVQKDIAGMLNQQLVILNGFDANEFVVSLPVDKEPLQLVWFSQNIDVGRGLENFIPVVNQLYPLVELHLVGNLKPGFASQYLNNRRGITIHEPMTPTDLHRFLSNCDIGLACDVPVNRNRELALTNKLLSYVQAGLYVISFPVEAQVQFLTGNDLYFSITANDPSSITELLKRLDKKKIREEKKLQYEKGKQFDWKRIAVSLINCWEAKDPKA